ncbi:ExbD/TolR family protein [Parasutterella excrementihominis]|jgi:biopolymer transport protein ExbD|uniref:ExbD/TolR family protein n=1 Tax=Parasutterella excrementihominis TaxID=487175 RepID=UPI000A883678|nr:biopolymer transporter ExbD [Parasutterella excrementihominis]MCX4332428.1 biopolymer transporter ExbD [Paramuribaculum sp.]
MAQIEQSDKGGKKKKGAQKKMAIHVDFTPMVDMNMLLITFFMLCTTMIKSQTLQITLPTNEKVEQQDMNKAKQSEAITLIVDTQRDENGNIKKDDEGKPVNIVYFFEGQPQLVDDNNDGVLENSNLSKEVFLGNDGSVQRGIRKILHDRNKQVLAKIDDLKVKWRAKELSPNKDKNDSIYQAMAKEIRNDSTLTRPVVVIKATPEASWESLISALDEMQINQISRYQIDNINHTDSMMIEAYNRTH